jgi:TPP-dependent pyruvate/acetoin dehydrogenase alpha subunit
MNNFFTAGDTEGMHSLLKQDVGVAIELLRCMKRIRFVEETIAERYSQWKMRCPTHLCTGQEAIAAGVCGALRLDDFVVSSHRAHGHYLAKGGDLKKMLAEIYGKATGCSKGRGGSMHLNDPSVGFMGSTAIVGGTIPVGVGLALSIRLQGTDQVSCVFFGDAAIEEGVFYESINFAVLKNLPVLFVCENNLYSVQSPLRVRQPEGREIWRMVKGFGCNSTAGDGNDVLEIYTKVIAAVDTIRSGNGPCFFEFATYRWREHCGPNFDDELGYRPKGEYLQWKKRDPILLLESRLFDEEVTSKGDLSEMEVSIRKEIEDAFVYADKSPFPNANEAFSGCFIEEPV